ncbi:hypothetical protein [Bacillus marinisedimentorum]|uniref:hypothetical protein n=1 Tax=Bacillus marinisedimentorum TaxID=1821260 RepID=UPI000872CA65|nr:hypothetical protein [Bacillus marinisedimentorum]
MSFLIPMERNRILLLLVTISVTVILTSCNPGEPLIITGQVNSMTVNCLDSDTDILIDDKKTLQEFVEKVNNGSRNGTHELELAEGHKAILNTSSSNYDMTLYNTGKIVVDGFYVDADVENFCSE